MAVKSHRALWIAGAVVLILVAVAVLSSWTSRCADYATGGGLCVYEPALGLPQSIVLAVASVGAAAFCVYRAYRAGRG
ncbi:hypothetical protein [Glaciihabitans tibetensis]|nr:hypothetical protein [Glaciihabitans tibetensis]